MKEVHSSFPKYKRLLHRSFKFVEEVSTEVIG